MKIHFWGTRGSTPVTIDAAQVRRKVETARADGRGLDDLPFPLRGTFGTATSCVSIEADGEVVVLDAGTGLRDLGRSTLARAPRTWHLFLSHLHWDHIQGFPFFAPLYAPGNTVHVHGAHDDIEAALRTQMSAPFFPVSFDSLPANIVFDRLVPGGESAIAGFTVRTLAQEHPGASFAYALARQGIKIVYATDAEHKAVKALAWAPFVEFFSGADILVFDAQFSLAQQDLEKRDWGHSSDILAVEFALLSGAKRLVLFHSDPERDDEALAAALEKTRQYARYYQPDKSIVIDQAFDGMEIELR